MPSVTVNEIDSGRIHANWTLEDLDEEAQTIDYYIVRVDEDPPILIKNTSATLFTEQLGSNHTISIRAVDRCGQKGEEAQEVWMAIPATQVPTTDTEPSTTSTDTSTGTGPEVPTCKGSTSSRPSVTCTTMHNTISIPGVQAKAYLLSTLLVVTIMASIS